MDGGGGDLGYMKISWTIFYIWIRVGIATGYGLDDREVGVKSPGRVKNFLFSTSSKPAVGSTQPPIQWVTGAHSPVVKRLGREADRLPSASAAVKKI
jgi:hypothetical protein